MLQYKIDFEQLSWESPQTGVRQKAVVMGKKRVRLVEYSRALTPHWCEKGHYGIVLKGELEIEFKSKTERFAAGDGVCIPAGAKHRHQARVLSYRVQALFLEDV